MEQLYEMVGKVILYGGGSSAISFAIFKFLGTAWLENKFKKNLEQLRHEQTKEVQRLQMKIDSMLNGTLRLQEKEFEVLPDVWEKLDEACSLAESFVIPLQSYADVNGMSDEQLEEFLVEIKFSPVQIAEIRGASDRAKDFQGKVFFRRRNEARKALLEFNRVVERGGIFFPVELKGKLARLTSSINSVLVGMEVGQEAEDNKMKRDAWEEYKSDVQPLRAEVERDIQARLQFHSLDRKE
ncbi:hypothetical protein ACEOIM_12580 [Pseudomonas aeruginosa]|nr:hypothetical protein [Pseudomonas aeruginosa]